MLFFSYRHVFGRLLEPNHSRNISSPSRTITAPVVIVMRYNDWDVLLFPAGRYSKTPFKEFGVACQVIPDLEQAHCQGSVGLPIVNCFVPSIEPAAPFQVSVHSWSEPEITQFTKSYSKHVELVQFEARVFIDGRLVAYVKAQARPAGGVD